MSRSRVLATLTLVALAVGACSTGDPSPSTSPASAPASAGAPTPLKVGLGFIPSVQFAPFYLAEQAGYYDEAGLDVTFENKIDPDLIALVGQGAIDVGIADGTSVIPAVSQGIPVRYLATIYGEFPAVVFGKASSGVNEAADLAGTRLGIPGKFGSSWIMLQALLGSAGLTPDDLEIVEYPDFGQGAAVLADAVDVATGFINNEPVVLELSGEQVTILRVDDITPLPGPGLIAGPAALDTKRDAVAAFVTATLRAMEEIIADPEVGLEAAIVAVPDLATTRETQTAILAATIDTWTGRVQAAEGLGALDPEGWDLSIEYMTELGLVPNPVTVDDVLDEGILAAAD